MAERAPLPHTIEPDEKPQPHSVVLTNYEQPMDIEGKLSGDEKSSQEYARRGFGGLIQKLKYSFFRQPSMRKNIKEARQQVRANTRELVLNSADVDAAASKMSLEQKPFVHPDELNAIRESIGIDEEHEARIDKKYSSERESLEQQLQSRIDILTKSGDRTKIAEEVSAWVDRAIIEIPDYYRVEDKDLFVHQITQSVEQVMDNYEAEVDPEAKEAARKINLHLGGYEKNGGKTRARVMLEELGTNPLVWTGASIAAKALIMAPIVGGAFAAFRKHRSVKGDIDSVQLERTHGRKGESGKYRNEISETFAKEERASELISQMESAMAVLRGVGKDDAERKANTIANMKANSDETSTMMHTTAMLQALDESKIQYITHDAGNVYRQRFEILKLRSEFEAFIKYFEKDEKVKLDSYIKSLKNMAENKLNERYAKQNHDQISLRRKKARKSGAVAGAISLVGVLPGLLPDEFAEYALDKVGDGARSALAYAKPFQTAHAATTEHSSIQFDNVGEPAPIFSSVEDIMGDSHLEDLVNDTELDVPEVDVAEGESHSLWQELISQQDQRDTSLDQYVTYGHDSISEYNELELEYYPEAGGDGVVIDISSMAPDADGDGIAEFPEGDQMYAVFYLNAEDHAVGSEIRIPIPEDGKLIINENSHPELLPLFDNSNGQVEQQFARLSIASENSDGSLTFYASNTGENVPQDVINELQQEPIQLENEIDDQGAGASEGMPSDDSDVDSQHETDIQTERPEDEVVMEGDATPDGPDVPDDPDVPETPIIPENQDIPSGENGEVANQDSDYVAPIVPNNGSGINPFIFGGTVFDKREMLKPLRPEINNQPDTDDDAVDEEEEPTVTPPPAGPTPGATTAGPATPPTEPTTTAADAPEADAEPAEGDPADPTTPPTAPGATPTAASAPGAATATAATSPAPGTPNVDITIKSGRDTVGSGNVFNGNNNSITNNMGPSNEAMSQMQSDSLERERMAIQERAENRASGDKSRDQIYDNVQRERNASITNSQNERASRIREAEIASQERVRSQEIQSQTLENQNQSSERIINKIVETNAESSKTNFETLVKGLGEIATAVAALSEEMAKNRQELKSENTPDSSKELILAALASNTEMLKTLTASRQQDFEALKYLIDAVLNQPNDGLKPAFDALLKHMDQDDKRWTELLAAIKNDVRQAEIPELNIKITNIQNINSEIRPNLRVVLSQNFREAQRARRRAIPRRGPLPRAGRVGPTDPSGPQGPRGPEEPTGPGNPGGPAGPQGPGPDGQGGPGAGEPREPGEPTQPTEPQEPTEPQGPTGQKDPKGPEAGTPANQPWRGFTEAEKALGRERSAAAAKEDFLRDNSEGLLRPRSESEFDYKKINNVRNNARTQLKELYPDRYEELLPILRDKITQEFVSPWKQNGDKVDKSAEATRRQWLEQLYDDNFYRELAGDPPIEPTDSEQSGPDSDQNPPSGPEQSTDNGTDVNNDQEIANQDIQASTATAPLADTKPKTGPANNEASVNREASDAGRVGRGSSDSEPTSEQLIADNLARSQEFRADAWARSLANIESRQQNQQSQLPYVETAEIQPSSLLPEESRIVRDFSRDEALIDSNRARLINWIKPKMRLKAGEGRFKALEPEVDQRLNQFFDRWTDQGNTTPEERKQWLEDAFSGQLIKEVVESSNVSEQAIAAASEDSPKISQEDQQFIDENYSINELNTDQEASVRSTLMGSLEDQGYQSSTNQKIRDGYTRAVDQLLSQWSKTPEQNRKAVMEYILSGEMSGSFNDAYAINMRPASSTPAQSRTQGLQSSQESNQTGQIDTSEPTIATSTTNSVDRNSGEVSTETEAVRIEPTPRRESELSPDHQDFINFNVPRPSLSAEHEDLIRNKLMQSLDLQGMSPETSQEIRRQISGGVNHLISNWSNLEEQKRKRGLEYVLSGEMTRETIKALQPAEPSPVEAVKTPIEQDVPAPAVPIQESAPQNTQESEPRAGRITPRPIDSQAFDALQFLANKRGLVDGEADRLRNIIVDQTTKALAGFDREIINKVAPQLEAETSSIVKRWGNIVRPSDRLSEAESLMTGVRAQELIDQLGNMGVEEAVPEEDSPESTDTQEVKAPESDGESDEAQLSKAEQESNYETQTEELMLGYRPLSGRELNYVKTMSRQENLSRNNIETLINQSKAAMETDFNEYYVKYQNEFVDKIEEELSYWNSDAYANDESAIFEKERLIESMFNGEMLSQIAVLSD